VGALRVLDRMTGFSPRQERIVEFRYLEDSPSRRRPSDRHLGAPVGRPCRWRQQL